MAIKGTPSHMNSPSPDSCLVLTQRRESKRPTGYQVGGKPCDKSPWQPRERETLVAIVTMRDLCSHMSTVAMATVRAGVDPKGGGG